MAQTAFITQKYPTTTTTANGSGISGQWSNPANIFADDGSSASAAFLAPPTYTDFLDGETFNLNIPPSAVIDGIMVEMEVTAMR